MKHQLTVLLLGEVSKSLRGKVFETHAPKSAPHYFESSVPHQIILGEEKATVGNESVTFALRGYPPDILLIQATIPMKDVFSESTFDIEKQILDEAYRILKRRGGNEELSEMYSVFAVSGYDGEPEQFLTNAPLIASLLKSEEHAELDPKEVEYTLSAQIKYVRHDLSIIDWDGAFLFDREGDFDPVIELLALANMQLLRHRILDKQLDERLMKMSKLVRKSEPGTSPIKQKELAEDLRQIINDRVTSIAELHTLERDIKLIGDWYSARFYDLAAKKFKIQDWRNSIKEKLDSIEDIYSIVAENFSVSSKQRAEWAQIIAFFILQIGWLVLIVLELVSFAKK